MAHAAHAPSAVHTPAQSPLPADWPHGEYTGTLQANAHTRIDPSAHGGFTPLLCLDMVLDNAHRTLLHVEQPFKTNDYEAARMAARRLKKGMRVTVEAPLVGLRLVARNATHIHVIKPQQEHH